MSAERDLSSSGGIDSGRRYSDQLLAPLARSAPWAFITLVVLNIIDLVESFILRCG